MQAWSPFVVQLYVLLPGVGKLLGVVSMHTRTAAPGDCVWMPMTDMLGADASSTVEWYAAVVLVKAPPQRLALQAVATGKFCASISVLC